MHELLEEGMLLSILAGHQHMLIDIIINMHNDWGGGGGGGGNAGGY